MVYCNSWVLIGLQAMVYHIQSFTMDHKSVRSTCQTKQSGSSNIVIILVFNFPSHACWIWDSYSQWGAYLYLLWFNFFQTSFIFSSLCFRLWSNEYETMKNKNQTGLKNFKPKINLNHNISTIWYLMRTHGIIV